MTVFNRKSIGLWRFGAAVLIGVGAGGPALAQELSFGGSVSLEVRGFADRPAYAGQSDATQTSLSFEPEIDWQSEDGNHKLSFHGFIREDSMDSARSHRDVREAYYRYSNGDWDIVAGVNRVFWGVTESRHLVNVINQVDAVEDTDGEDFLGQLMLQVGRETSVGRFDLFVLPGLRERKFPSTAGRLRVALPVDTDGATYQSSDGADHVDMALRYSHYIGDVDIGFHLFHGTSREPNLTLNGAGTALVPHYPIISQAGIDLQYTTDSFLWKLEALVREGQGTTFGAAVAGFEYTLYQLGGSNLDLGLIAEIAYDDRDASVFPTIFDQDLFLAGRLALNDTGDTSILAGVLVDRDTGPTSLRIEAERRLGDNWSVEAVGQVFLQDDPSDPAQAFEKDSHLSFQITRHF